MLVMLGVGDFVGVGCSWCSVFVVLVVLCGDVGGVGCWWCFIVSDVGCF